VNPVEKMQAVLTTAFGSSSMAKKAMQDIQEFAATTPYQVNDITAAYIKMVNRGITPTMAEMTKIGDIAAVTGKSFDELTDAILAAGTGETERLKAFGIVAKQQNGEMEIGFRKYTKTVTRGARTVYDAILGISDKEKGVAGTMESISATLIGKLSNLEDSWMAVKKTIGDDLNPVVSEAVGLIQGYISKPLSATLKQEKAEFNILAKEILSTNKTTEERRRLITQMQSIAPEFLKGITDEGLAYIPLGNAILNVNNQMDKKIQLMQISEKLSMLEAESTKNAADEQYFYKKAAEFSQAEQDRVLGSTSVLQQKLLNTWREYGGTLLELTGGLYGGIMSDVIEEDTGADVQRNIDQARLQSAKKRIKDIEIAKQKIKKFVAEGGLSKSLLSGTNSLKTNAELNTKGLDKKMKSLESTVTGRAPKIFTININKMIETFNLSSETAPAGMVDAKRIVLQGLTDALNDAQMVSENF